MKIKALVLILLSLCKVTSVYAFAESSVQTRVVSERFVKGSKRLNEINGEGSAKKIVEALKNVSPDLATYAIEYGFGDLLSRKVMSVKTKEMIIIANLAALGNAQPQLKAHINAALNVGVTQEEIAEIMILTSAYAGFPAAINGTLILKSVLTERAKNPL